MSLQDQIDRRFSDYRQQYSGWQNKDGVWYDPTRFRPDGTRGWEQLAPDENGYNSWYWFSDPPEYVDAESTLQRGMLAGGLEALDDYSRTRARADALNSFAYGGNGFETAVGLIKLVDPSATEEDVYQAALKTGERFDAPGQYMPSLRVAERIANTYLSDKTGRQITLSDNPQFAQAIQAAEAAKHDGFSLRESWPIFAMFLGPWLSAVAGPALAGAIGSATGASATTSTIAANAAIQGGLGATGAAVTGGDVLQGAAVGAVSGGLSGAAPAIQGASQVGDFVGLTADQAKAVASATSAAVKAYASGGDPVNAAAMALAGSVAGNMLGDFSISDAAQKIASSVANGTADTLITQASDTGDGVQISTADATTLGQGLPKENMSGFFDDVINWDEGSDWLTGGDQTAFADGNVWDESMATQEQVAAAAAGYLNNDGSIDYQRWFADIDRENPYIDSSTNVPASEIPWNSVLRRLPEFAKLFPGGQGLTEQAKTWLSRMANGGGTGRNASGIGGRSWLDIGLATAPALAAISYARNMSGPDTSRLEKIYGQMDPAAALGAFDLQTNDRRSSLETNLARRGVLGSSFANDDLTTFNTARDVGRRTLLNSGLESQAKVATDIAKMQDLGTQRKVDLYGRALNSLGLAFGGSRMMGG